MNIQYLAPTGAKLIPLIYVQYVFPKPEMPMRHPEFRYTYRPSRFVPPRWLCRIWAWL